MIDPQKEFFFQKKFYNFLDLLERDLPVFFPRGKGLLFFSTKSEKLSINFTKNEKKKHLKCIWKKNASKIKIDFFFEKLAKLMLHRSRRH